MKKLKNVIVIVCWLVILTCLLMLAFDNLTTGKAMWPETTFWRFVQTAGIVVVMIASTGIVFYYGDIFGYVGELCEKLRRK